MSTGKGVIPGVVDAGEDNVTKINGSIVEGVRRVRNERVISGSRE